MCELVSAVQLPLNGDKLPGMARHPFADMRICSPWTATAWPTTPDFCDVALSSCCATVNALQGVVAGFHGVVGAGRAIQYTLMRVPFVDGELRRS